MTPELQDLIAGLREEGDLCKNEGVDELSSLLWQAADALEAMSADAERLDWLETMANKRGGILLHDGSEGGRLGLGLRPGCANRTLRQAIDSARKGER